MKLIWLHIVRAYLNLGLFFYFKNISVYGADKLPKGKPLLFLSNHQNALLDALLIATKSGRFSYYLTRASVFKKPCVRKMLKTFNMIPVYRVRDGWGNISNNNSIFTSCTHLLHENNNICIFPEGSHNLNRTVRPLSKGFTRIVFETLDRYPKTDLQLVPIGLNFQNAVAYPDSVSMYFGNAMEAKVYLGENRTENINSLKGDVHRSIRSLTTHIPSDYYDETVKKLDNLNVDYLNPKAVNDCIASNFTSCYAVRERNSKWLRNGIKFLFSIAILGPFLTWKFLVKPKIKEIEFLSTFRFAVGITLVPLWIVLIAISVGLVFSGLLGLSTGLIIIILGLLTVKMS